MADRRAVKQGIGMEKKQGGADVSLQRHTASSASCTCTRWQWEPGLLLQRHLRKANQMQDGFESTVLHEWSSVGRGEVCREGRLLERKLQSGIKGQSRLLFKSCFFCIKLQNHKPWIIYIPDKKCIILEFISCFMDFFAVLLPIKKERKDRTRQRESNASNYWSLSGQKGHKRLPPLGLEPLKAALAADPGAWLGVLQMAKLPVARTCVIRETWQDDGKFFY